jgi:hypothetical protein
MLGSMDGEGVGPTGSERADLREPFAVLARDHVLP